ncbi:MAG: hypothetical protein OEM18_06440 [Nitrosopumilus sp.]|nr:hypothetical protein [Nitrosopumilus sp.]
MKTLTNAASLFPLSLIGITAVESPTYAFNIDSEQYSFFDMLSGVIQGSGRDRFDNILFSSTNQSLNCNNGIL